jgi:MFS family permease
VTEALAARRVTARKPLILASALLGNVLAVGIGMGTFGLFLEPVAAELGVQKTGMGLGHAFGQVTSALGALVLGWWVLRRWLRPVLLGGVLCISLGLLAISNANAAWQAALAYMAIFSIGALCAGPSVTSVLVTRWYDAGRGRALGTASAGTTLGGALFPPLAAYLIGSYGWREAMALLGIGVASLLPIFWLWIADRPQEDDRLRSAASAPQAPELEFGAAVRDARIWLIALIFGLAFAAGQVMLIFTPSYALELGFSLQAGAYVMTARALAGALGKVMFGWLSDRFDRRWLLAGMFLASAILLELFLRSRNAWEFAFLGGAIGFMSAPLLPLQQVVIGAVFGRDAYAPVQGLLSLIRLPLGLAAAPLFGFVLDSTGGDYALGFRIFVGAFFASAVLLPLIRVPAPEARA